MCPSFSARWLRDAIADAFEISVRKLPLRPDAHRTDH